MAINTQPDTNNFVLYLYSLIFSGFLFAGFFSLTKAKRIGNMQTIPNSVNTSDFSVYVSSIKKLYIDNAIPPIARNSFPTFAGFLLFKVKVFISENALFKVQ